MRTTHVDSQGTTSVDEQLVDQRIELMKRHWKTPVGPLAHSAGPIKSHPQMTIAISREKGALGSEIAALVGKQLHWPVYDRDLIDLVADRAVLRTELLESIDEHDRSWLMETLVGLAYPGEISSAGYVHHLKHIMIALASHGGCIIVGRGAAAFLPHKTTLRIRFHAPFEIRAERVSKAMNVSIETAKAHIKEVDKSRANFVADHFGADVTKAESFDIALNTEKLSTEACVKVILSTTRAMQAEIVER